MRGWGIQGQKKLPGEGEGLSGGSDPGLGMRVAGGRGEGAWGFQLEKSKLLGLGPLAL